MQKLFTCLYGSRLYGTQTPTSDLDVKHIVLPELDDLLVLKRVENKVKQTNTEKNTRNSADDVDEEFIPLQIFARHFMEGQTYALELAFAIDGDHAQQTIHDAGHFTQSKFVPFVHELREKFLTSNIKAMMGYVVNQASLYSFKGERLNATRELKALLEDFCVHFGTNGDNYNTEDFAIAYCEKLDHLCTTYPKYVRRDQYDIGGGRLKPCLIILEKTLPYTNTVVHSLNVLSALEQKYGARADAATEHNVDWKATMHALRIVDEGLTLLETHRLAFPFSENYVQYLLSVKRGELPLDPIKRELSEKLERLKDLEKTTTLPMLADVRDEFDPWLARWMRRFYNI